MTLLQTIKLLGLIMDLFSIVSVLGKSFISENWCKICINKSSRDFFHKCQVQSQGWISCNVRGTFFKFRTEKADEFRKAH